MSDSRVLHALWVGCVQQPFPRGWVALDSHDTHEGEVCRLAAMSAIRNMEPCSPEAESFTVYLERIQLYFHANAIGKVLHVPVLLSLISSRTYMLL